jgi:hypothetical protein
MSSKLGNSGTTGDMHKAPNMSSPSMGRVGSQPVKTADLTGSRCVKSGNSMRMSNRMASARHEMIKT